MARAAFYHFRIIEILDVLFSRKFKEHAYRIAAGLSNEIPSFKHIVRDIQLCHVKYRATPDEYFEYDFLHKNKEDRDSVLTDKFVFYHAAKKTPRIYHDEEIEDKYRFYELAKDYFKREAFRLCETTSFQDFYNFTIGKVVAAKPNKGTFGRGVGIFNINTKQDVENLFEDLKKQGGEWVIEEKIEQSDELSLWNDSSVNTVRVNCFLTNNKFNVWGVFFRTGRKGSVVDNAGSGGILCAVDAVDGKIISDGVDEQGHKYRAHPESGIVYLDWQIPRWGSC